MLKSSVLFVSHPVNCPSTREKKPTSRSAKCYSAEPSSHHPVLGRCQVFRLRRDDPVMCGLPNCKRESVVNDLYLIRRTDGALNALTGKARWHSTLQLSSGYSQMGMHEKDKQKTAFRTRTVMSFPFFNALAIFERFMEKVLDNMP